MVGNFFYFTDKDGTIPGNLEQMIIAYNPKGATFLVNFKGGPELSLFFWSSCQIGKDRLFQYRPAYREYRLLKINAIEKTYAVEKERKINTTTVTSLMVNFNDRYIYVIGGIRSK